MKALSGSLRPFQFMMIVSAVLVLAGCDSFARATPTPLPTVVLGSSGAATPAPSQAGNERVTASGVVVPGESVLLAFPLAAEVETVAVATGDQVDAGQVLARLAGSEELQAALTTAELEVLTARQALQKLEDDLPAEQATSLRALQVARATLRAAEQKIAGFGVSSEPIDVEVARSNVALAKRSLDQARKDFRPYENKPEGDLRRAALLSKLSEAQKKYDATVNQLNRLTGITVPEFDRSQAQIGLEIAQAELKLAEEQYELLKEGPDPMALELAQARLKVAEDQTQAARASLSNLELKAPFAGTVSEIDIHPGEWVIPGRGILVLADLDDLLVETTDLSERDIPRVEVSQPVTIFIKALSLEVPGRVREVASLADTLGGDVVYKTTIDLETMPAGLRAGMSVEVRFEQKP